MAADSSQLDIVSFPLPFSIFLLFLTAITCIFHFYWFKSMFLLLSDRSTSFLQLNSECLTCQSMLLSLFQSILRSEALFSINKNFFWILSVLRDLTVLTQVFLWIHLRLATDGSVRLWEVGLQLHCNIYANICMYKLAVLAAHIRIEGHFLKFCVLFVNYHGMKILNGVQKEVHMSV